MTVRSLALASLFLSAALFTPPPAARADMPPPDDYVEECTIEKQQKPGMECNTCGAWHGDREACDKTLGVQGFRKMCKGWGASAWTEVWCKGEASSTPDQPDPKPAETPGPGSSEPQKKSGCDVGDAAPSALLAVLGAFALRRRRARA